MDSRDRLLHGMGTDDQVWTCTCWGHGVRRCGQVLRGVSEWSLVPLFPLSEHMGALPCHNTMVHCGTCKDVRGMIIMHTYE